jgi:hypothetical protein
LRDSPRPALTAFLELHEDEADELAVFLAAA